MLMRRRTPGSKRTDTLFPYTTLVRSDGATLWSGDGSELVTRELGTGNHILVNGGLDDDDPLVPHFTPLLAVLPDPELNGEEASTAQTWGPWIQLMAGAGLATDDSRALIVRRTIEGRTYRSTSASLVALAEGRVRYDFNPAPRSEEHTSELQSLMRIS